MPDTHAPHRRPRAGWVMSRLGDRLLGFADDPEDDFELRRTRRLDILADTAAALVMGTLAGLLVYIFTG